MAAMAAAASTLVMAQQPASSRLQGDHAQQHRSSSGHAASASLLHLRRTAAAAVSAKPMLWHAARGSRNRSSFVVVAAAAEAGGEDEKKEVAGILESSEGEEVAALLEPPAESIDEGYVRALNEESGSEEEEVGDGGEDVEDLKQQLIDSLYGTERGIRASSDTRAEVVELITQLEAKNPTPAPTEALSLLNGKWILAYTSYSELYPLLAAGNLPLVKVGEISQTIDAQAFTVENSVSFEGPLTTTSLSASASFEVRSPKRVQIKFEEGIIGTPKLTDSIEVPSSVDVMGQKIDLTPVRGLLQPLQDVAATVVRTISGQPPLKFSIQADRAQSWLLTTFLDEDIRISRGDGGSVFVLVREGSTLLY